MRSENDKIRLRLRLAAVKEIGKSLLKLKSRGLAMTALRESRVSAAGWPDFFISGKSGRTACLALCMDDGNPDVAPELLIAMDTPGSLQHLAARLREVRQSWKLAHPDSEAEPSLMILCPRWPEAELRKQCPELTVACVHLAGKESCQPARLGKTLLRLPTGHATEADIILLRSFLAPETILQPAPSRLEQRQQSRAQQLSLLPQLLDYNQDLCAKLDLWLPDEGRETVENFALRLVTGAAGTGKSVVLVHRAALLKQFHPGAHIAVLTHNRALCSDLERRYQRMSGSGGVEFLTFYSWLGKRWPSHVRALDDQERMAFLPASLFDGQFLKDEFDWIHDQGLLSTDEYLAATRTGRTKALRESQRREVFALLEEYRYKLDAAKVTDWSRRAFSALASEVREPRYDFILVDEAQFFARTWLVLVRRALKPGGHLFLCADPAQGFLGRGQSWRDAGLEVKGRSIVLKHPYRNTLQILNFAAERYEHCVAGDEEAPQIQPTRQNPLRNGPTPSVITVTSPQDELATVVRQVGDLISGGACVSDILILCARRRQLVDLQHQLTAAGLPVANLDAPAFEREQSINAGTIDSATGLERPIVVICGLREFSNHEQNPSLPEDERRRHRRLNASRLYMACTRAMERLIIVSCGAV